ncbi:hypothetical protein [Streptomyces sennicomposti]
MRNARDLDGRMILPRERLDALGEVLRLRAETMEAGNLPYPEDWPLPLCPECHGAVQKWISGSGDGLPTSYWFSPCGHGIVADRP